jgi:hypothetical protein
VSDNRTNENGKITVVGNHKRLGSISDTLKKRMLDNGIPAGKLAAFLTIPAQNKTQKGGIHNAMDTDHHLPAGR